MTYDPRSGSKLREAILRVAERTNTYQPDHDLEPIANVVQCYVPDPDARRQLYNTLIDAIFRYLLAAAKGVASEDYPRKVGQDEVERFIRRHTAVSDPSAVRSLRQALIGAVRNSEAPSLSTSQKDRIRRLRERDNCYLCGQSIHRDEDTILDHQWPKSAGGGSGENILKTHAACEAAKRDLAFPGDAPIFRLAFAQPPEALSQAAEDWWPIHIEDKPAMVGYDDRLRSSLLRIAVLRRQDYKCYSCGESFKYAGPVSIIRREDTAPWWYANVIALCEECNKSTTLRKHDERT
jgi:5-methylcytosine-specific restriction endonuclease McrA